MSARPTLDCPECSAPLIPADARGRYDRNGDYHAHRDECRCPHCAWWWWDDSPPVRCACGADVCVRVDDDQAYSAVVEASP